MQWYLAAPLLFRLQRMVTDKEKAFFAGVSAFSLLIYLYARNMIGAYWLQGRLWQFCAGVIAALYLPKEQCLAPSPEEEVLLKQYDDKLERVGLLDSGDRHTERSEANLSWPAYIRSFLRHPVFLLPLLIPVMWFRFPTFDLRLYITAASALLLYAGQKEEGFMFLTNRAAVFLGDISYVLYLTHWPLHCIAKYNSDIFSKSAELGICITTGIALLVHFHIARFYREMSSKATTFFFIGVVVITVFMSMKEVNYENDRLHYATIGLHDAYYDIVNSIY
ncbi:unnamed protein product [Cylicocyclus nassatus]|uniref:Acyltransferase 3 domain-containing protein n=1 Tax=Cylicocyclus nassatus TaxID=53992 RepID=A0AA36HDW7_CYLNA|nr:unnamed protein product [Cylicocyclus nassatus]